MTRLVHRSMFSGRLLLLPVVVLAACGSGASVEPAELPAATQPTPAATTGATGTAPGATAAPTEGATPGIAQLCAEGEPDCDDTIEVGPSALPLPTGGEVAPAGDSCLAGATECPDVPLVTDVPEGMEPTIVEPNEGLVEVEPIPWIRVLPNDDQTAVQVTWWNGNPGCRALAGVEVSETDEAVTITVLEGRDPQGEACTDEALLLATTIELSGELGPRSILDGAAES